MKPIKNITHVVSSFVGENSDGKVFFKNLDEAIERIQNQGLEVEIQYQISGMVHGALVIGREP